MTGCSIAVAVAVLTALVGGSVAAGRHAGPPWGVNTKTSVAAYRAGNITVEGTWWGPSMYTGAGVTYSLIACGYSAGPLHQTRRAEWWCDGSLVISDVFDDGNWYLLLGAVTNVRIWCQFALSEMRNGTYDSEVNIAYLIGNMFWSSTEENDARWKIGMIGKG